MKQFKLDAQKIQAAFERQGEWDKLAKSIWKDDELDNLHEFNEYLDRTEGTIKICGKVFHASDILRIVDNAHYLSEFKSYKEFYQVRETAKK